jgi:hypothetical protein
VSEDLCSIWQMGICQKVATVAFRREWSESTKSHKSIILCHTQPAGRNKNNNVIDLESFCVSRERRSASCIPNLAVSWMTSFMCGCFCVRGCYWIKFWVDLHFFGESKIFWWSWQKKIKISFKFLKLF